MPNTSNCQYAQPVICWEKWWAQQDSNLRLPPCEGGTLPLSYAPVAAIPERIRQLDGLA